MNPLLRSTLIKVALPLIGIVIPMVVAKLRGFELRDFFGLHKPKMRAFAVALALWIAWMAITELVLHALGQGAPDAWPDYPASIVLLRVLAIGILGPIAEELIFRGVIYGRIAPKLGPWIAIVLIAIVFGLIHTRYDAAIIAVVTIDGLLFGIARYKTGSVYTPIAMHMLGNLFSVCQSLRLL